MLVQGTPFLLTTLITGSLDARQLPPLIYLIDPVFWTFGRGNKADCTEVSLLAIGPTAAVSAEGGRVQGGLSLHRVSIGVGQVQL